MRAITRVSILAVCALAWALTSSAVLLDACGMQGADTLPKDAAGCLKAIPTATYIQVIGAAAQGDGSELEKLGLQIGETLAACAARDLVAIFEAKSKPTSAVSTSQPEPIIVKLKAYAASKGKAP